MVPGAPVRRLALLVEYEGTGFGGSQYQKNTGTIQDALERALSSLTGEPIRVALAGRTDAGVHARGQVAAFSTRSRPPLAGRVPAAPQSPPAGPDSGAGGERGPAGLRPPAKGDRPLVPLHRLQRAAAARTAHAIRLAGGGAAGRRGGGGGAAGGGGGGRGGPRGAPRRTRAGGPPPSRPRQTPRIAAALVEVGRGK